MDGDWRQVTSTPDPSARSNHALTFDSTRGLLLLFGGDLGAPLSDETWQ